MALDNYRDLSVAGSSTDAGFRFEFSCQQCGRTWKSPFRPYRRGQLAGWLFTFAYYIMDRGQAARSAGHIADIGSRGARAKALEEAQQLAAQQYTQCPKCEHQVCGDCYISSEGMCQGCSDRTARSDQLRAPADDGATRCPNCSTPANGRFCAECGFDLASTHKSCPGCGAMCLRQARFCTDCGHSF